MQDKMNKLLENINMPKEFFSYFENGILEKIALKNNKTEAYFILNLKEQLPVIVFDKLCELIFKKYDTIEIAKPYIKVKKSKYDLLNEYINYFMELSDDFEELKECKIIINENVINFEFKNEKPEYFNEMVEPLIKDLKFVGYNDINIIKSLKEANNKFNDFMKNEVKEEPKKIVDNRPNYLIKGKIFNGSPKQISDILYPEDNVIIECEVFGIDTRETPNTNIITLKVTDKTDSIYCKIFEKEKKEYFNILKKIKDNKNFKIRGKVQDDNYSKELVLSIYDMISFEKETTKEKTDDEPIKRVELHTHTKMSGMDGVCDEIKLVKQAIKWGHKAIAITDHNSCQAFPHVFNEVTNYNKKIEKEEDKFKAIYGAEITIVEDKVDIVINPTDELLDDTTFVVFDTETTGFNAGLGDSMIEIGAVKIKGGVILDRFDELINPGYLIDEQITEVTSITNNDLIGKPSEEEATRKFKEWAGNLPLVAHNAKFDISMLEMAYEKYNLGELNNTIIDTLEISRTLDRDNARHGLSALVKRYNIPFEEDRHHRGDYDAEGTGLVLMAMINKLKLKEIFTINDLNKLCTDEETYKFSREYHVNVLAKNKQGLKNLFKIISYTNTNFLHKTPRIPKSIIDKYRDGLLIGAGCSKSEVFNAACMNTNNRLEDKINFYDYVEIQPLQSYQHLIKAHDINNENHLKNGIKRIISLCKKLGKLVVASGDVHNINVEDKIYREIIVNQKVPGGGRHPLAKYLDKYNYIPNQYFMTTKEMLDSFSFLDKELREEIVIKNTNLIADMIDVIEVIIDTGGIPFSPKIENSKETTEKLVYDKAKELYGDPLPELIEERIKQELSGIIKGGFDVIYLIAQKLVKKSNDDGYLVGSRGSVGSSFVATMMGITEVNPLPAHYRCPNCKNSIFEIDGEKLGATYSSGYDLPEKNCPNCNTRMLKEGQDMPFATFLGFDADKVPDIDLNFSGEYQAKAHDYTKVLFGEDYVYRAGTISTVADKTAYGFVLGYYEDRGIKKRSAEIERLAVGCTGVKRTTGQHPGGIVVIPNYMDVFDFTPFQYPADDVTAAWRTTHFDYHAIDQDVLKLDILGHDDPTVLKMLGDLTGKDVTKVPLDDKETMGIFCSPTPLGISKEDIMCETGTLGVPEFGTKFVIGMLNDTKPKTFAELVKISGLSHGTDVWLGNAQELIKNDIVPFKDVIGCRDDIMTYLMYQGMDPKKSFKIMEFVRKGKASKDPETWQTFEKDMQDAYIDNWFIDSCSKIKYMFPKAHACAYVMSAYRIAWFKVHMPIYYYDAYFSIRCFDFDLQSMVKGKEAIKNKIAELLSRNNSLTNKEQSVLDNLYLCLEATARGFKFANIDIMKSDSTNFIIDDEFTLIPPFRAIDGLGSQVSSKIIEERKIRPFISIEDLQKRAKISSTIIEKMRVMGILDGMDESSQLSLF